VLCCAVPRSRCESSRRVELQSGRVDCGGGVCWLLVVAVAFAFAVDGGRRGGEGGVGDVCVGVV